MKKRNSRALSLLLALSLALGLACLPVAAEEAGPSLALSQSSYDLGAFTPEKVGAAVGTDVDFPPRYEFTLINQGDEPVTVQSITAETTDCVSPHSVVVRELSGGSSTFTLAPGESSTHSMYVSLSTPGSNTRFGSYTATVMLWVTTSSGVAGLPLTFAYELLPAYEIAQTAFDLGQISTDRFASRNGWNFGSCSGVEQTTMTNNTDSDFSFATTWAQVSTAQNDGVNYITPSGQYVLTASFQNEYNIGSAGVDSRSTGQLTLHWTVSYVGDEAQQLDTSTLPTGKYTAHVAPRFQEYDSSYDHIIHEVPLTVTFEIVAGTAQPGESSGSGGEAELHGLTISPSTLDFGTLARDESVSPRTVTITNTGTERLDVTVLFNMYGLGSTSDSLEPGESMAIQVAPNTEFESVGSHEDLMQITTRQDSREYTLPVRYTITEGSRLEIRSGALEFGSMAAGDTPPRAQTVRVYNTGDLTVDLMQPVSQYFTVEAKLGLKGVRAGSFRDLTVVPRADLAPGTYQEDITVRTADGAAAVFTACVTVTGTAEATFTDVSPGDWYYGFVETVAEKKLFAGNGDGTFAPENNMTYAEFLAVLFQFSGDTLPTVSGGNWYDGHVAWARQSGLIPSAMLDGFDPEAAITRQDMAALFGAFLARYPYAAAPVNTGTPSFTDAASIADYARDGVTLCWQLGIFGGNNDGTFAPGSTAIRAEVAVTMVQMARVMGR